MEYQQLLNVKRSDLYQFLLQSALEDIIKYKPGTTIRDLHSGFNYEKDLSGKKKKANTIVTIKSMKKDEKYVVTFETLSGITTTSYLLQDKDGKTQVTFKEEFNSRNGKSSAGLFESLFKKRSIKKLQKNFNQIEEYLNNKENPKAE